MRFGFQVFEREIRQMTGEYTMSGDVRYYQNVQDNWNIVVEDVNISESAKKPSKNQRRSRGPTSQSEVHTDLLVLKAFKDGD